MRRLTLLTLLCLVAIPALAALTPEQAAENQPVAPFRIIGDVYYVGASDVASYLISTPGGLILLDGGFAQTAPQIERNIRRLGFEPSAVKILLNGHAHPDHAGGLAALKRDTGAQFYAMDEEVKPLEHNGRGTTFYHGDRKLYESIHVDHVLHDGDRVSLAGVTLMAHLTAGHTPGCTTWTMEAVEGGTAHDVVFMCQLTLLDDEPLTHNANYPRIATDYAHTFALLSRMPCDVFLSEHGRTFDLKGKLARLAAHPAVNPFIDPAGCRRVIAQSKAEFEAALAQQRRASSP
ncbi:MAG TPA: subclass B3 metallo-beta-lactamase [Steroidobacteraceae bacterium]|jgi:metallo-beta-lactamase class B